jgi:hypothetical protein
MTAACGSAGGDEGTFEDGSVDAEGAVVTSVAAKTTITATSAAQSVTAAALAAATRPITKVDACGNYDAITAAIGSRTIDCLGTIGADSYGIDGKGRLVPRFKECKQGDGQTSPKAVYEDILALLSIQERPPVKEITKDGKPVDKAQSTEPDPLALRCIAGRWEAWNKQFAATEIKNCPVWKKIQTLNPPTPENVKGIGGRLPDGKKPQPPGTTVAPPHENYEMALEFPNGVRDKNCRDEADCARKCSAGFSGLWIKGEGKTAIIDPTYWWITLNFPGTNPFMAPGYYHPMSYYGTIPGALYGHRNRKGEACSRFVLDAHILLSLQLDCLDPNVPSTCVTVCAEPIPDTTGTETQQRY